MKNSRKIHEENIIGFALSFLCTLLLALGFPAEAQQPQTKVRHIGFLSGASLVSTRDRIEAFRQGLRALGYVDGTNVVIEWRFAEGDFNRLPGLAADLVQLKVDVMVVAGGEPVAFAAKRATQTTPIIMANAFDPVTSGLIGNLARPGGNITGFTTTPGPEIHGKQTELLRETIPKLSRLGILINPTNSFSALALKEIEAAAQKFAISIQVVEVRSADDLEGGFVTLTRRRAQALLQVPDPTLLDQRTRLIELETKRRLPAMHSSLEYADAGALMAYGADRTDLFRRAAGYVDKILKGAEPGKLPVEQPTKFEFVINLKTAKQIGLTIPQSVLFRADKVIK
jgi:putative tryptophan/tyrosine transport system substrate-binding protein